jgi:hypothetical protein
MRALAIILVLLMTSAARAQTAVVCYNTSSNQFNITMDAVPACYDGTLTILADVGSTGDPASLIDITSMFYYVTPPLLLGGGTFGGGPSFCGMSITIYVVCVPANGLPSISSATTTINCNC